MDDGQSPALHPALALARYGKKHDGDRFVGFWLALVIEGRQYGLRADTRQTQRIVKRFFAGRDVVAAVGLIGADALHEQLRDAAEVYYDSCLSDPQYSSTLWRTNRLEPEKLRGKMARDTAKTLGLLGDSGALAGLARPLPTLLTDGLLGSLAPHGAEELARAVAQNPSAVRAMEWATQA
ncbi:MAG: DUF6553 family protein [Arachnia sp.]